MPLLHDKPRNKILWRKLPSPKKLNNPKSFVQLYGRKERERESLFSKIVRISLSRNRLNPKLEFLYFLEEKKTPTTRTPDILLRDRVYCCWNHMVGFRLFSCQLTHVIWKNRNKDKISKDFNQKPKKTTWQEYNHLFI